MRDVCEVVGSLGAVPWVVFAGVGAIAAFVFGYHSSPLFLSRLELWRSSPADGRKAYQLAAGAMSAAIVVRVAVPKDASWFGQLGDYFNPPLAVVSLVILAQAIGLQRRDLVETRRALRVARRQLRDSRRSQLLLDSPWVLVKKLCILDRHEVIAELLCVGTGPAINVVVSLWGQATAEDSVAELRATTAVLAAGSMTAARFAGNPEVGRWCPAHDETLRASVEWQNVHGVLLRYEVRLRPASHGGWEASAPLVTHRPFFHPG